MKSQEFYAFFPRADVRHFLEDADNNVLFDEKAKFNVGDILDDVGEPAFWQGKGPEYLGLSNVDLHIWKTDKLGFWKKYRQEHYFDRKKEDSNVDLIILDRKFWEPIEWSFNPNDKVQKIQLALRNVNFEKFRIYVGENQFFMLENKLPILNFGTVDEINWEDNKNEYCLGLKIMYILSYIGGMSMQNLNSDNNLAKSLGYFYFYYHLNKFYNYRNFLQYDVGELKNVELFKTLYHWTNHRVHYYKHMKMGESEFKKHKDDVIANVRKKGDWIIWQERGEKRNLSEDYKKLIKWNGNGLTKKGQLLFQESCQAYVYSILGAQAKTRWKIIGDGANSLQTQRVFLTLVDEVVKENNLSMLIKSMRLAIKQTNVRLNFCISPGLELIPTDMIFIKDSVGYNNVLLISNDNMKFGSNGGVNNVKKIIEVENKPKIVENKPKIVGKKVAVKKPEGKHILATSLFSAIVLRFLWMIL